MIRRWLAGRAEQQRSRDELNLAYAALLLRTEAQRRAWHRGQGPAPVFDRRLPGEMR